MTPPRERPPHVLFVKSTVLPAHIWGPQPAWSHHLSQSLDVCLLTSESDMSQDPSIVHGYKERSVPVP